MNLDTLDAAQALEGAGIPEKHAKAIVKVIRQSESGEWRTKVDVRLGNLETGIKFLAAVNIGTFIMVASAWISYMVS